MIHLNFVASYSDGHTQAIQHHSATSISNSLNNIKVDIRLLQGSPGTDKMRKVRRLLSCFLSVKFELRKED
uniref:AlNc14C420G11513 protein n=1 Tax=Albugo laibachii Nc14 TaxID=890382 RepID=F0WZB0_9STRA|nr:AlNc14C420G11513 [Albugo laibachii Nc14]|eukprot:CCA26828.1 AlNc14C420G11513 [Albugo laibachii Nc14]